MSSTPQVFAVLGLVYLVTNARIGSGPRRRRVQRVMVRPEREAVTAVLERLPVIIADWSDGLAAMKPMHVVEVRRPLATLSSSGEGRWWAGPRDCRAELLELASDRRYDSVIALWPCAPDVPLCGWGCTIGPSEAVFGAGFSSIASDHWPTLATDPDPAQGFVHEWLHQVEAIYRGLGFDVDELPSLHDAAEFTSTRPATEPPFGRSYAEYHDGTVDLAPARTWAPWYRDWMTGRLRRVADDVEVAGDAPPSVAEGPVAVSTPSVGLTRDRWARRSR